MWGFPAAFLIAAVAVPAVAAIFFYRRRSRELEIPAVHLWSDLGRPVETNSWASLLRRLLSLLLQVLLVLLLIVALADPYPARRGADLTVIVIDCSATLQTREGAGRHRLDLAKISAQRVLDELPPESLVAILTASPTPALALPATADLPAARQRLAALAALDVDADLPLAVRAAAGLVDPKRSAEVVVISDFAAADPDELRNTWQSTARLRLIQVGAEQPDAAVTALRSEPADAGGRNVVATISQRGLTNTTVPVHLAVNNRRVATQSITLTAVAPAQVTFTHPFAGGDVYQVEVESGDALPVDDVVAGIVPRREAAGVCLVTNGNPTLEKALLAQPNARVRVTRPADFTQREGDTVIIVDRVPLKLPDTGRAAGYLFINTPDPFGWAKTSAAAPVPAAVTHWAGEHPSIADVDPTVIHPRAAVGLEFQNSPDLHFTQVVGSDAATVIGAIETTRPIPAGAPRAVRALYWAFDPSDSDLPRRLTFPLLLWNSIEYLADGGAASSQREFQLTARPLALAPSANGAPPAVRAPDGATLTARDAGDGWTVSETRRQGVYRRTDGDGAFAVNLLSSRGVRPLPHPAPETDSTPHHDSKRALFGLPLRITWGWVLLAAAAAALAEWILFHRRIVRIG